MVYYKGLGVQVYLGAAVRGGLLDLIGVSFKGIWGGLARAGGSYWRRLVGWFGGRVYRNGWRVWVACAGGC